jgi:dolichyl-phosphate-mannose-protein mannosyltransferase
MNRAGKIFALALTIKLTVLAFFLHIRPGLTNWGVNEAGMIARSLVLNHSYGGAFHDAPGPTAWLAPAYPSVLAGVFSVLGIQSHAAAVVLLILNCVLSAITAVVVLKIGTRCFSETVGFLGAIFWAVSPTAAVTELILWDSCLAALLLSFAIWMTVKLEPESGVRDYLYCGAIWGGAGLVSPSVLAPFFPILLVLYLRDRKTKQLLIVVLAMVLVITPWTLRNVVAFHTLIPIRSNGWSEIYFGNVSFDLHPSGPSMQYQTMGERAFVEKTKSDVLRYLAAHPMEFSELTMRRAFHFWTLPGGTLGLSFMLVMLSFFGAFQAIRKTRYGTVLISVLIFYPMIYYVSYTFSRYRHPIEPIIYVLSAYGVTIIAKRVAAIHMIASRKTTGTEAPSSIPS